MSDENRGAEGHRFLEHTTDAYIEAWGPTLERTFAQAAEAFYETMLNVQKIDPILEEHIQVDGHDKKELLYNWIEQLLLEFDIKAMVYASYHIIIALMTAHRSSFVGRLEARNMIGGSMELRLR